MYIRSQFKRRMLSKTYYIIAINCLGSFNLNLFAIWQVILQREFNCLGVPREAVKVSQCGLCVRDLSSSTYQDDTVGPVRVCVCVCVGAVGVERERESRRAWEWKLKCERGRKENSASYIISCTGVLREWGVEAIKVFHRSGSVATNV